MNENQNMCNGEHCCCHNEPKKKSSLPIIILVIVLLCGAVAGGYFLGTNKDNKETKNSSSKKISSEKLNELLEKSFYWDIKGNDIISKGGLTEGAKLALAFNNVYWLEYEEQEQNQDNGEYVSSYVKNVSTQTLISKEKNIKSKIIDGETVYYFSDGDQQYFYNGEDLEYYPYETINKEYKALFNQEAPKKNFVEGVRYTYYYCESINGYVSYQAGMGALFVPEAIHKVKDYNVDGNKLTMNVYYASYDYELSEENDKVIITMDNDKNIKYTYSLNDVDYLNKMTNDMIKNHKNKLDIVKFIYTIDGDNYYLTEIKK